MRATIRRTVQAYRTDTVRMSTVCVVRRGSFRHLRCKLRSSVNCFLLPAAFRSSALPLWLRSPTTAGAVP